MSELATNWQKADSVGGHGELVESVEAAQLPWHMAQLVVVCSHILQGDTVVQAVWETHKLVHGHVQSLQFLQITDLWRFNTDRQQSVTRMSPYDREFQRIKTNKKNNSCLSKEESFGSSVFQLIEWDILNNFYDVDIYVLSSYYVAHFFLHGRVQTGVALPLTARLATDDIATANSY